MAEKISALQTSNDQTKSFLQKAKIPNLLCKLKKRYNLLWLQDFCWQPCNCSSQSKISGLRAYN
eukprot:3533218-Ditylum_brightwellii.AAC.1